ncbi:hypothetical protein [Mucilaginibacter segetis]|uniref:Uncharacterized protein n=1 Tax=Mucilaginibacter segetis TaxID=2793071 RepID=A0A934PS73_9SPHI|nr:hypothetical protein [Mucilaginibacter segetis]MBK0379124.1 hypothetical protein [Mucilaginibacter segetis]
MFNFYRLYTHYIIPSTALLPIFFAVFKYKYLPKALKVIFWYVLISAIINLINRIYIIYGGNSILIYHLYGIFEFCCLSLYFMIFYDKKKRRQLIAIAITFAILCIINLLFIQNKEQFNSYTRPIGAILIALYSMQLLFKQNDSDTNVNWADNCYNWINTGLLLYYASGLLMFVSSNYILKANHTLIHIIFGVSESILALEYILFAIGFYKCKTKTTIFTS